MSAKSMANLYLNGKRAAAVGTKPASPLTVTQPRFKSSTSNLATRTLSPNPTGGGPAPTQTSQLRANLNQNRVRGKSTSMTNLLMGEQEALLSQKTASRNALDSIHNGMNAKYAQVQSKVYQNLTAQSKVPVSGGGGKESPSQRKPQARSVVPRPVGASRSIQAKVKTLEEQLERLEEERELARQELERERAEKQEQVGQLKSELQEKIGEHERSSEEYHQKLLEAYELADGNRRATDSLLSESRQRDEENRKKVEELERQLAELREFVVIKEEMSSKMVELREQLREERERYEQQLKSVSQLFENEKIRLEAELMEKVRQVGESYELNKYKGLTKTMELDVRLATDRLQASKAQIAQLSELNEQLNERLRQTQERNHLLERQLVASEGALSRLTSERRLKMSVGRIANRLGAGGAGMRRSLTSVQHQHQQHQHQLQTALVSAGAAKVAAVSSNATTQTGLLARASPPSRTRTIISHLRQRLKLASARAEDARQLLNNLTNAPDSQLLRAQKRSGRIKRLSGSRNDIIGGRRSPAGAVLALSGPNKGSPASGPQVVVVAAPAAAAVAAVAAAAPGSARSGKAPKSGARLALSAELKSRLLMDFLASQQQYPNLDTTALPQPQPQPQAHTKPRQRTIGGQQLSARAMIVQYELPEVCAGRPIALGLRHQVRGAAGDGQ